MTLDDVRAYILERYQAEPIAAFTEDPGIGVFARPDNGKWFAVTKNIRCSSVDVAGDGRIDILNVRLAPRVVSSLRTREGFRSAWHMNRNKWVTVLLDGSVADDEVRNLIDEAYRLMG
jgi:predicted DNA-binding protein (MmcQ/YjbR family)